MLVVVIAGDCCVGCMVVCDCWSWGGVYLLCCVVIVRLYCCVGFGGCACWFAVVGLCGCRCCVVVRLWPCGGCFVLMVVVIWLLLGFCLGIALVVLRFLSSVFVGSLWWGYLL